MQPHFNKRENRMRVFGFSFRITIRRQFSEFWRHVGLLVDENVSEERESSIFRLQKFPNSIAKSLSLPGRNQVPLKRVKPQPYAASKRKKG